MLAAEPKLGDHIIPNIRKLIPLLLGLKMLVFQKKVSPSELSSRIYTIGLGALHDKHPVPKLIGRRIFGFKTDKDETPVAFIDVAEHEKNDMVNKRPRVVSKEDETARKERARSQLRVEGVSREEPHIRRMRISHRYMNAYMKARKKALEIVGRSNTEYQLRLLRLPALNFEAIWIYANNEEKNMLIPLRSVGELTSFKPVNYKDALNALRKSARRLADADKTMGG